MLLLAGLFGGLGDLFLVGGFLGLGFNQLCFKAIHYTSGVDQFRLTRIKGVALRTNFNFKLFLGGAGGESMPAGARHLGVGVEDWVDFGFHNGVV